MHAITSHSLILDALHIDVSNYRKSGSYNLEDFDSIFTSSEVLLNVYTRECL